MNNKMKYVPRKSCGLGNKLLGLISSIAYGFVKFLSLKVHEWDSLWWYFDFPIKLDKKNYLFNSTFYGHFYAIKTIIENKNSREYLIKNKIIENNQNIIIMVNNLAYIISKIFLNIKPMIKSKINHKYIYNIDYGIHIRTGKADGKEYLLHYLTQNDTMEILQFIHDIKKINNVYISSDSSNIKILYKKSIPNILYRNSSNCNSGYGLLINNNSCALESIIDYYILSKCKYLVLTRCSSFSLVSLFANEISKVNIKRYIFYGRCKLHSDLYC